MRFACSDIFIFNFIDIFNYRQWFKVSDIHLIEHILKWVNK